MKAAFHRCLIEMSTERLDLLRAAHRSSAVLVSLFVLVHLANHLAAFGGQEQHIAVMAMVRPFYRNQLVELLLLIALGWQVISGLTMVFRRWRERRGWVAWVQAASGGYIAVFLMIHVGAVLSARAQDVDTNFNFAAAGIHAGAAGFFVPYYVLAVAAFGAHLGCALYWHGRKQLAIWAAIGGMVVGTVIVALLAGLIVPVTIPTAYLQAFT